MEMAPIRPALIPWPINRRRVMRLLRYSPAMYCCPFVSSSFAMLISPPHGALLLPALTVRLLKMLHYQIHAGVEHRLALLGGGGQCIAAESGRRVLPKVAEHSDSWTFQFGELEGLRHVGLRDVLELHQVRVYREI